VHIGQPDVADELAAAAQEAIVFLAQEGSADALGRLSLAKAAAVSVMAGLVPTGANSLIRNDRACPGHPRRPVIDPREVRRGRPAPLSGLHPGTVAYTTTWMTGTSPVMTTLAVLNQRIWGAGPAMAAASKPFAKHFQI
jgi:hypothetical protein